jgi:adenylate cyclase
MQAEMLEKVNSLYSLQIDRIARQGVEVSARYAEKESAVPLPASFLTELGHSISQSESGMQVRHYSEYPFRPRTNRGPQDDFEREALLQLHERPDQPFYRFVHDDAGDPVLRYTIARRMQTSCVTCHNTHPDSIKKDWKPGEVGGVLEIIRPLRSDRDRIRQGLRGTFALASGVAGCSLSACLLVILSRSRKAKRH